MEARAKAKVAAAVERGKVAASAAAVEARRVKETNAIVVKEKAKAKETTDVAKVAAVKLSHPSAEWLWFNCIDTINANELL